MNTNDDIDSPDDGDSPELLTHRDRGGFLDALLALATGATVWTALSRFASPGLDPELWNEAATIGGLVIPSNPIGAVMRALPCALSPEAGAIGGGVLAALIYASVRTAFILLVPSVSWWRRLLSRVFSLGAALLAVFSAPVWRSCQVFSPTLYHLVGLALAMTLFLRWLTGGIVLRLYATVLILGWLAADCPFAILLLLAIAAAFSLAWKDAVNGVVFPDVRLTDYGELPAWRLILCFSVPFVSGVLANMNAFVRAGGLSAAGWSRRNLLFHYVTSQAETFLGSDYGVSFLIVLVVGVLPMLAALRVLVLQAADGSMSVPMGASVVLPGLVAVVQVLPIPHLWVWRLNALEFDTPLALALMCICAAVAAVFTLACFVLNYEKRADDDYSPFLSRVWSPLLVVAFVAVAYNAISQQTLAEIQGIVDEAVAETVTESAGADWLFTDGSLDRGLELEAARRHVTLHPLDMMAGDSTREVYLRARALADPRDAVVVRRGAVDLLNLWARERPDALDRAALQLGVANLAVATNRAPVASGLVVRTRWPDPTLAKTGAERARDLSLRALRVAGSDGVEASSSALGRAFADVVWRLASLARLRGDAPLADQLEAVCGEQRALRRTREESRLKRR